MNVLVLTANQLRHFALLEALARAGLRVRAHVETLPPRVTSGPALQAYYARMAAAERACFGSVIVPCARSRVSPLGTIGVSDGLWDWAERVVVFGSSWLRGSVLEQCVARRAINVHLGLSPYYRGSAPNFWAAYDGHPEYVGGTLHFLTAGLDSGPILSMILADPADRDPWRRSMAVAPPLFAQIPAALARTDAGTPQDPTQCLRYSRAADFTDAIAAEFLERHGDHALR